MRLFTMAYHGGLHCDALLIDSGRSARTLVLDRVTPLEPFIDTLLERLRLMSRTLHAANDRTYGLFCAERGGQFVLAAAYPIYASLFSALRDMLEECGTVSQGPNEKLSDGELFPLVAFADGYVSFFNGPETRQWTKLAAQRGLPIVASVWSHEATDEITVDGVPASEYLAAPEEVTLDLDITDELPQEELERLLREHRRQS